MKLIYALVAFTIGIFMNVQSGVNGQIRIITGNPVFASTVNFAVGTAALLLLLLITCKAGIYRLPSRRRLHHTQWWMWTGGPLGVIYVMAGVLLPAAIGFGAFFSMLVTGQLLFSAMVDQLNLPPGHRTEIGWHRICGILLLIAGAFIIQNT